MSGAELVFGACGHDRDMHGPNGCMVECWCGDEDCAAVGYCVNDVELLGEKP